MRAEADSLDAHVDEYLWPLTGELAAIDWTSLTEELRIRERLTEIITHVRELHVQPRLRRLVPRADPALTHAVTCGIIAGPEDGPPWTQRLNEPVPRALRDEWNRLAHRLGELNAGRNQCATTNR